MKVVRHYATPIAAFLAAGMAFAQPAPLRERIAAHLRPNDLKADVSFLASDALEGRGTPSAGLNLAAEYIAAQFRRAGLEPVGDDGYFQTATFFQFTPNPDGMEFKIGNVSAPATAISLLDPAGAEINDLPAFKATLAELATLTAAEVQGKVLIIDSGARFQSPRSLTGIGAKLHPAMIVLLWPLPMSGGSGRARPSLRESQPQVPVLGVWDPAILEGVAAVKSGPMDATVTARIPAPKVETVKLRNVAGVIRGADPALKDTYLVVTGHYDHLGINPALDGDKIYNGANDDASGTSSVIGIAGALASLEEKPKRTIVFVTVFGEEVGGLGSRWYTGHPIFPLAKTIANINLEQLGRTDDSEGPRPLQFNLTGFDYTDIAATFVKDGAETGIQVIRHEKNSDAFFGRSDNAAFADAGVPSTTLSVSYVFPDYHRPGDEWPKLDYDNMAKVDRCIALGVWTMANGEQAPQWNKENPKVARYVQARERP